MLMAGITLGGHCLPPSNNEVSEINEAGAWTLTKPTPPAKQEALPDVPLMQPIMIHQIDNPAPTPLHVEKITKKNVQKRVIAAPNHAADDTASGIEWRRQELLKSDNDFTIKMSEPPLPDLEELKHFSYQEKGLVSSDRISNTRILTTDRYIGGVLETGINTQLDGSEGGPVIIQTSDDVFGYHDRNILIPKGSRLVCNVKALGKVGNTRTRLRCHRILLAQSRVEIFGLKADVVDQQGSLGVSGDVDNRFFERYGSALFMSGLSAAVRIGATTSSSVDDDEKLSRNKSNNRRNFARNAGATAGEELSQRFGEITADALERYASLIPILKIAQGTRIVIRPDTDWYLRSVEQ
jgi:type IV secretion system protein VirB10